MDVEAIVSQALRIESTHGRAEFLDRACEGDSAVRERVDAMIDERTRDVSIEATAIHKGMENAGAKQEAIHLLDRALSAGLLSELDIRVETKEFANASNAEMAAQLVARKLLTEYQAQQLLKGKGSECVLSGRYILLDKIGAGGMGHVFRAHDKELDREVAIKLLSPHNMKDDDAIIRFRREARTLAQLTIPNVVQAFDAGADGDRNFLVMEFVRGVGLHQILEQQKCVPPEVAADYGIQVAAGMQAAHKQGMIHRDIKPSNLLVCEDGTIKILDLGLARFIQDQVTDSRITRDNMAMGTPDYMPPEQFRDARRVDERADIYSLGCTLYHLMAGEVLFPGSSLSEKADAHENREPPALEEKCREVPSELSGVIKKMLAKRADARPHSMLEVVELLAPFTSRAVTVPTEVLVSPAGSRARSKIVWIAVVGIALVSLLVTAVLWWPGGKSSPQRKANEPARELGATPQITRIRNGLTVAKNGRGQFTSINKALQALRAGMTLRILDDAEYDEIISIGSESRYSGITIESDPALKALPTIRSAGPATVHIANVTGVRIRRIKFSSLAGGFAQIRVSGDCSGCIFEHLEFVPGPSSREVDSIFFFNSYAKSTPATIQRCVFRQDRQSIVLHGAGGGTTGNVVVRDNRILESSMGIKLNGQVARIIVAANRVEGVVQGCAILLDTLAPATKDLLVANNTVFECTTALGVFGPAINGQGVRIQNNLMLGGEITVLGASADLIPTSKGWTFSHNYCEMSDAQIKKPTTIPASPHCLFAPSIPVVSRDAEKAGFLRPVAKSKPASKGAGQSDSSLPSYIGAIPPAGTDAWSWDEHWPSD